MNDYQKPKHKPRPHNKRREKIPPEPAKPSVVRFLPMNQLMDWAPDRKQLFLNGNGNHHIFPAKTQAQTAVWHSVQKSGQTGSHVDYRVEEV